MQSEFDKDIDSLLRESARRGRAAPVAPVEWGAGAGEREADGGVVRAASSGAHLDADEQNAYAENSLPAPARTYYAAHLADCDMCRRSVTQLALAAGVPAQLEQQAAAVETGREVLPGVGWRERLGALFAPRAWRYAVPALALLLVSAVTWIVLLRGRQSGDVSVARNNTTEQAKQQPAPASETHHAPQNGNNAAATPTTGAEGMLTGSNSNAPVTSEEVAVAAPLAQGETTTGAIVNEDAPPPPPVSSVGAASAPAPVAADAAGTPVPEATPIPTAEPSVGTPEVEQKTKASERADESAKDVQKLGNYETNQQRDRISGPRRNEQSRNMQRGNISIARDGADKNAAVLSATPVPAPPAATAAARRSPPREADAERKVDGASSDSRKSERTPAPKPAAETRTVAGRKFRRAGGAWVDTAYSSQAVTVVRRNSEQYRALVADEPELRRISDALGGEITVVWKGRAYRIR